MTQATIRCIPLDQVKENGKCVLSGKPSEGRVLLYKSLLVSSIFKFKQFDVLQRDSVLKVGTDSMLLGH